MTQKRLERPGLSGQWNHRFAPAGIQLQLALSAEAAELSVGSTRGPRDAEWGQSMQQLLSLWLELLCSWERRTLPAHTESPMKVNERVYFVLMYLYLTLLQEGQGSKATFSLLLPI